MSTVSYKKIFAITVTHDYYENSIGNHLDLSFGQITQELKRRFDVQMNKVQDTFSVYINSESSTEEFLNSIKSDTSYGYFDFFLEIRDPNFYNYTDVPFNSNASYIYESDAPENIVDVYSIALSRKPLPQSLRGKFDQINIYFEDLINSSIADCLFTITFHSRATFWQYYIINESEIDLSNSFIKGNVEVDFEEPKQIYLENGQLAIDFTTKTALRLSEFPNYKFDLFNSSLENNSSNENTSHTKTLFRLPSPNPKNLKIEVENGKQKLLSPMYIYV